MFCKNCGNEIPDGSNVCGYCGTPVSRTADAGPSGSAGTDSYTGSANMGQGVYGESAPNYSGSSPNPNQYQNQNPGGYPPPNNMDGGATGMAVASMVIGIVALVLSCCAPWWLTLILGAVSIVLGILALNKHTTGKGMAIAGIVCSAVALVLELIMAILGATLLSAVFSELFSSYQSYNCKL